MAPTTDPRTAAAEKLTQLMALLQAHKNDSTAALIQECEALARAISAFHMEGIRFRIFNVDRLLARPATSAPAGAAALLEEVRHHLETAGFHTRSHQAPG